MLSLSTFADSSGCQVRHLGHSCGHYNQTTSTCESFTSGPLQNGENLQSRSIALGSVAPVCDQWHRRSRGATHRNFDGVSSLDIRQFASLCVALLLTQLVEQERRPINNSMNGRIMRINRQEHLDLSCRLLNCCAPESTQTYLRADVPWTTIFVS